MAGDHKHVEACIARLYFGNPQKVHIHAGPEDLFSISGASRLGSLTTEAWGLWETNCWER